MAKQFYDMEEAQEKLGLSAEELKALIRDGQLREFRDGGAIRYKAAEVDELASNLSSLSGSLSGDTGELILEPSDESSMGLTGSDMLTLDEADRDDDTLEEAAIVDDQQEDTVITSVGISVFDDEDVPEADPAAQTVATNEEEPLMSASQTGSELGLEMSGTGSGLLDLTREADDTSLGAELLDEIYSEDQDAGITESADADSDDTSLAASAASATGEATTEGETLSEPDPVEAPSAPAPVRVEAATGSGDAVDVGLSGAMLAAILILGFAGISVAANVQHTLPQVLVAVADKMPIYAGAAAGATLLFFIVGLVIGKKIS